jgi:hypothetical protein
MLVWLFVYEYFASWGCQQSLVVVEWSKAEMLGFACDARIRLIVISACGISRSHSRIGKAVLAKQSPAIKWFLNVWMARLAALRQWVWGGTS